ncbi:MAG: ABC transporter substrate-binding protein [Burkholderiales bacterium PBB5]|nr:MAG: ABC transporter substrate-binding protein [Burkholderiales bacterium PBB5]
MQPGPSIPLAAAFRPHPSGWRTLAALLALAASLCGPSAWAQASAAAAPIRLRIVGGLGSSNQFTRQEEPFWTRTLPALTGGKVQAEIVAFDRAGIRGQDMLRLLQQGVVPFGTALLSLSLTQDAIVAAPDLAGVNPDMATLRRNVAAYRPVLANQLRERHGLELLAVYAYPAQVVFCKQALASLADLAKRRVRVSSVTQADLVEALGGTAVFVPFAEMLPQMRAGTLDCAITGTMSGNTMGLHEVTTHLHPLAINWGVSLFVANRAAWAALPADLRQLLNQQLPLLEQAIWADADRETGEGIACNTGAATCINGQKGHMTLVKPTAADAQRLRDLLAGTVLPRWVARCGARCADAWNDTLAPTVGVRATR